MTEAAASARLCVETAFGFLPYGVVKRQPPPRGCVLKPFFLLMSNMVILQPPPRGCVLKQETNKPKNESSAAAASARLCVETFQARGLFIF